MLNLFLLIIFRYDSASVIARKWLNMSTEGTTFEYIY